MTISDAYRQENRAMHQEYASYGGKGSQWAGYLEQLIREDGHKTVLDYGCGKGSLKTALEHQIATFGLTVAEYDPAILGKETPPEPADLVVCTDVMEHIEPDYLDSVLADLARVTKGRLFLDISTQPANKLLPSGKNPHLIVENSDWWKAKLGEYFEVAHWVDRPDSRFCYGEALPKGSTVVKPRRRRLTPEHSAFFDMVRRQSAVHADAKSTVKSINMFEGVDDQTADYQIVADVLDGPEDPKHKIAQALKLTRKVLTIRAAITPERTAEWWKSLIEKQVRIAEWVSNEDSICATGTPRVGVAGVKVVGAVKSEDRWEQVKAACARISKRVARAPAHDRTAIIACYGPSIRDTITLLADQASAPDADVVSVSGAHDFLIAHGVAPTYHVECDPRAHKADNIDHADVRVQYLIGSGCHPVLLDKLERADVALWHIATSEHVHKFISELGESGSNVITGGGSVGLRAISLLFNMGYRKFHIHGMDCSFANEGRQQWAGKHAGKAQDVVQVATIGGEVFDTSLVLMTYATDFVEMVQAMPEEVDIRLYGEGFLQAIMHIHRQVGEGQQQAFNGALAWASGEVAA